MTDHSNTCDKKALRFEGSEGSYMAWLSRVRRLRPVDRRHRDDSRYTTGPPTASLRPLVDAIDGYKAGGEDVLCR